MAANSWIDRLLRVIQALMLVSVALLAGFTVVVVWWAVPGGAGAVPDVAARAIVALVVQNVILGGVALCLASMDGQ